MKVLSKFDPFLKVIIKNFNSFGFSLVLFFGVSLTKANASSESKGVEFYERKFKLSREALKSFSSSMVESQLYKSTDINELRFSLRKNKKIDYILGQKLGQTVYKKWNTDDDPFFEQVFLKIENKDYLFEEFFTLDSQDFHQVRKRFYPLKGTPFYKIEVAFRNGPSEEYKVEGSFTYSSLQMMTGPVCKREINYELDYGLVYDIQNVVENFGVSWDFAGETESSFEMDSKCDEKLSQFLGVKQADFASLYHETINEGLLCLQNLANGSLANSFSNILYLNAVSSLAGQSIYQSPMNRNSMDNPDASFPRRVTNNNFEIQKVLCSQNAEDFTYSNAVREDQALGFASTHDGVTTELNCGGSNLEIRHPFISLNFDALSNDRNLRKSRPQNKKRKIKELIFHEFLHTTGVEHQEHYDPVYACAIHCFQGGGNGENQRMARDLCRGENMGPFNSNSLVQRVTMQVQFALGTINRRPRAADLENIRSRLMGELQRLLGREEARRVIDRAFTLIQTN